MKHLLLTTIAAVLLVATTAFADPIHEAANEGDLAGVQAELDKGADVNAKDTIGRTPLTHAAQFGHKEIAELLIANGADVNKEDDDESTPLHYAALKGQKEIAELLIAKGADMNAVGDLGRTPLDLAYAETAALLRKHGGKTGEELKAEGKEALKAKETMMLLTFQFPINLPKSNRNP
jgi:cytohesin